MSLPEELDNDIEAQLSIPQQPSSIFEVRSAASAGILLNTQPALPCCVLGSCLMVHSAFECQLCKHGCCALDALCSLTGA